MPLWNDYFVFLTFSICIVPLSAFPLETLLLVDRLAMCQVCPYVKRDDLAEATHALVRPTTPIVDIFI